MTPGTRVGGRFVIETAVASGGMGTVHRAKDVTTGRPVALKILRDVAPGARERLEREANTLSEMTCAHVVRYVAHGVMDGGEPYLVMEWIDGETLAERLVRAPLTTSESIELLRVVARALAHVHERGLVHRDIKPGNLVLRDREVGGVTLVDFGLVRPANAEISITGSGTIIGTPAYMAPEQARGERDVGPPADVFALGCVLFRCLTGKNAFEALDVLAVLAKVLLDEPPRASDVIPKLDARIDELLARMLAKDPDARPQNGAEVERELDALGPVEDVSPARASMRPPALGLAERKLHTLVIAATDFDPDATVSKGSPLEAVHAVVRGIGGARCELLANGAIAVTIAVADSAKERAAKAATCALELARILTVPIVVVTGHTIVGGANEADRDSDAFDRAARLLRSARAARVTIVDETTASLIADRFVVEAGPTGLELRGASSDDDGVRTVLGERTPFVGRERELVTLEAVFDECVREGAPRAVLVTGPPGIGKSRLRRELAARLRNGGKRFELMLGAPNPLARAAPYAALARAVNRFVGANLAERVRASVPPADADRVADFLAEMCMIETSTPSPRRVAARASPVLMHEQVQRAFCDFISAECARAPVVLVLEDFQWVDALTTQLALVALASIERPLLVLAFARPEIAERVPNLWASRDVVPLPLSALPPRAAIAFVKASLPSAPDAAIERIVARAGGNALYLEELVRAEHAGRGDESPETVIAMAQSRLARFDDETRRVIRGASVFSSAFSVAAIRAILPDAPAIEAHVDLLLRDEVFVRVRSSSDGDLAFGHGLVRDAAHGMLTEPDARLGHRLAAEYVESLSNVAPDVVAEHFVRSDQPSRAVAPLLRSAQIALDASDFASALSSTARVRALSPARADLGECALIEARANRWLGRTAAAFESAREALDGLEATSPRRLAALGEMAYGASYLGRAESLEAVSGELLAWEVTAEHARAFVLAAAQTTSSLVILGKVDVGERLLAKARPHLEPLRADPAVLSSFLQADVACAAHKGDLEALLETATAAQMNAELAGDERSKCVNAINAAFALLQLGEWEPALAALERAREDSERLGLVASARSAMQNIGYALFLLGRVDEARRVEQALLSQIGPAKSPRLVTLAHACLALIEIAAGDAPRAMKHASTAVDTATGSPQMAYALVALAKATLAGGDPALAVTHADRALAIMAEIGGHHFAESTALRVRADALAAAGREDEARAASERARERMQARADALSPPRRAPFLRAQQPF